MGAVAALTLLATGCSVEDPARGRSVSGTIETDEVRVASRYGDTLYGRLAAFRIGQCDELLAGHELKVGEYYASIGKQAAALSRYRYLVEQYPTTDAATEARRRLPSAEASAEPGS